MVLLKGVIVFVVLAALIHNSACTWVQLHFSNFENFPTGWTPDSFDQISSNEAETEYGIPITEEKDKYVVLTGTEGTINRVYDPVIAAHIQIRFRHYNAGGKLEVSYLEGESSTFVPLKYNNDGEARKKGWRTAVAELSRTDTEQPFTILFKATTNDPKMHPVALDSVTLQFQDSELNRRSVNNEDSKETVPNQLKDAVIVPEEKLLERTKRSEVYDMVPLHRRRGRLLRTHERFDKEDDQEYRNNMIFDLRRNHLIQEEKMLPETKPTLTDSQSINKRGAERVGPSFKITKKENSSKDRVKRQEDTPPTEDTGDEGKSENDNEINPNPADDSEGNEEAPESDQNPEESIEKNEDTAQTDQNPEEGSEENEETDQNVEGESEEGDENPEETNEGNEESPETNENPEEESEDNEETTETDENGEEQSEDSDKNPEETNEENEESPETDQNTEETSEETDETGENNQNSTDAPKTNEDTSKPSTTEAPETSKDNSNNNENSTDTTGKNDASDSSATTTVPPNATPNDDAQNTTKSPETANNTTTTTPAPVPSGTSKTTEKPNEDATDNATEPIPAPGSPSPETTPNPETTVDKTEGSDKQEGSTDEGEATGPSYMWYIPVCVVALVVAGVILFRYLQLKKKRGGYANANSPRGGGDFTNPTFTRDPGDDGPVYDRGGGRNYSSIR